MGLPKKFGSAVNIGGNIPILGKKPKRHKLDVVNAAQLNNFLFDIAFGFCEMMTALEMKIDIIAEEQGIDLTLEEGEYKTRFEANLPVVMGAFGLVSQEDNEGVTTDERSQEEMA